MAFLNENFDSVSPLLKILQWLPMALKMRSELPECVKSLHDWHSPGFSSPSNAFLLCTPCAFIIETTVYQTLFHSSSFAYVLCLWFTYLLHPLVGIRIIPQCSYFLTPG